MTLEEKNKYYILFFAKFPYHKYAVGYSNCCPSVGDPEYHIALRNNYCALNMVNTDDKNRFSIETFGIGVDHAVNMYNHTDKIICFVDNTLNSVAPIASGAFLMLINAPEVEAMDFNAVMVYIKQKIGVFYPKNAQLAMVNGWLSNQKG